MALTQDEALTQGELRLAKRPDLDPISRKADGPSRSGSVHVLIAVEASPGNATFIPAGKAQTDRADIHDGHRPARQQPPGSFAAR